jgi:hypothetical protein
MNLTIYRQVKDERIGGKVKSLGWRLTASQQSVVSWLRIHMERAMEVNRWSAWPRGRAEY